MLYKFSTFIALVILAGASTVQAQQHSRPRTQEYQTIDIIAAQITVNDAETVSVPLAGTFFVRNLVIQAQGRYSDSTVEVMVNGQVKGTLYAPGRDPSYIVTVEDWASSIQFRHRHGGAMQILDVKATVSTKLSSRPQPADEVEAIADAVISLVSRLQPYSTYLENETYLLPIKIKAGEVRIMNAAHGKLGHRTRQALINLQAQIELADPYIDYLLNKNALFEAGVELLTIKETIREWLN